ncbi:MAG: hypothetical protein K0S44_1250 [Bacteroidetes bacterium]|jgi:hypothetical protein|nr:hypothetical protein [Bacteroidota bacterium]
MKYSFYKIFFSAFFFLLSGIILSQTITQTFTTTGTWTCPASITSINVQCWGAGGGGGYGGAANNDGGGGGGGGAYTLSNSVTVVPGNTYNITVGLGGSGGISTSINGVNGGASSGVFGATTVTANPGQGGIGYPTSTGGAGGTAGTFVGGSGANGSGSLSGGGGGGAGSTGAGGNASGVTAGTGTSVGGGNGGAGTSANSAAGGNGSSVGGGGGGGTKTSNGGNGADGQVIITYTIPPCAGTPAAGTASASTTSAFCSTNSTLTLSGHTNLTGITIQWQSSPDGSIWSNIAGATSATYSATAITTTTYYRTIVTCSNGGATATSNTVTVTISTPNGGTAAATPSTICLGATTALSLSGHTTTGVTYQWQSSPNNSTWTNVTGATSATYTASPTSTTYYRCVISCSTPGITSVNSSSVLVTVNGAPTYTTLPYSESFEGPWISFCNTREVPNSFWNNTPKTGNNSWRRNDDGVAAASWTSNNGSYSPVSTLGSYSARFHSYNAASGTQGSLDLYVDCSTAGTKYLTFDFINTSGSDVLTVLQSTDGGSTFPTTLATYSTASAWTLQSINITSTSATTVIRFRSTSDFGGSDIGLDDLSIVLPCTGTPTAGVANASPNTTSCSSLTSTLSLTGYVAAGGITFQWQSSPNNSTWTNITGATSTSYIATVGTDTYFRCIVTCPGSGLSSNSTSVLVTSTATIPANDECANAITLVSSGTCTSTSGTISCASMSSQASGCFGSEDDDVWYKFVATTTIHDIDITNITGSTSDLYHSVYSGTCASPGTEVVCSDPNSSTATGLTIGNTYYIRVYSYTSTGGQTSVFDICVTGCTGTPANDDCSSAVTLTPGSTCNSVSGSISCATASSQANSCAGTDDDDVWYKFVASASTHYINLTNVSGSTTDLYHAVYSGNCTTPGTAIECSDPNTSTVTGLTVGNTYYIRVYTYTSTGNQNTTFDICVTGCSAAPSNDECAGAVTLTSSLTCSPTAGTIGCATASSQSNGCAGTDDDDVWYSFVATAAVHNIAISGVSGTITDMYHSVYSGSCSSPGTELICSDPNSSSLTGLTIGNTYYIRVYSYTATTGQYATFNICVTGCTSTPANDNCSGATPLTINAYGSCAVTSSGNVQCATASGTVIGACSGTPDDDIWYSFVATSTAHPITLTTTSGFNAYMQLYAGGCGTLNSLLCSDANDFTASGLTIGQTYYLRISSFAAGAPNNGALTVCISNPPSCPANLGSGNVAIASLPYNVTGQSTCGAGDDITTTNAVTCGSVYYFSDEDKVYTFTPASSGTITITINSTQSWTGATLYDGCPFSANCVGYVQSSSSGSKNFCTSVAAGTTYYLVIDSDGTTGGCISSFSLDITAPSGSTSNDLPCNATPLTIGTAVTGDNTCASGSGEPAVPSCWTSGSTNTVWFSFVAPASGTVYAQTTATTITSTQIAIYSGTCGSSLTQLSCNQSPPTGCTGTAGTGSLINASGLTPGATYYVRVDGRFDYKGTFSILVDNGSSVSTSPVPGQDCTTPLVVCSSVMTIGNPGYSGTGNVCDFTGSGNCTSGELNSVWYQVSIAATGNFNFTLMPNDGSNNSNGAETDYDFLLWKVSGSGTTTNCATISSSSSTALLSCNFSGDGVTGIAPGGNAPAPINSYFNGAFQPTVSVTAGDVLYLVIQNYSGSTQGFTLDMTTSGAGVVNYTAPSTVYWTGGANTIWSNTTNWGGCSTYPICGVNAVITAASATQPIITGTEYVKDLTINPGATLTLSAGAILHVCGNFTNNGTFIASPTSTVIFDNAAVAQSVSGSFIGANKFGHFTVTKTGSALTANNDIDIAGNFTTSNSTSVFNTNNFYIKVAGNFVNASGNTTYTNTGTIGVLEFNGSAAQTYTQGASQLDLNKVVMNHTSTGVTLLTDMNIKATTGSLTLTLGKIHTTVSYKVVVSNSTSTSVSTGNTSSYINGFLRRYINNLTGSYDFPVGTSTAFERANINFTAAPTITYLTADFQTYATVPAALGSTECSTTYDASALDNGFWNIEANTVNNNTGQYNMTLYNSAYTNPASGWTIMSRHNGSVTWALVNGDGSAGTCVASPVTAVVRNNMVGFSKFGTAQSGTPLPIELASFSGFDQGTKNKLEWTTMSETNNDYFSLERSENGNSFEQFVNVDGAGNSTRKLDYFSYDHSPFNGITYYRLKQTDFDGKYTYSSIIAIENNLDEIAISNVHPNPTTDDLNFDFYSPVKGTVKIQILDLAGRVVFDKEQNVEEGKSSLNTEMGSLAKGIYSLKVIFNQGNYKSLTKIIKY